MGNFNKWMKKNKSEALNEMNTLGRAQFKSNKAFSAVGDSKFNTMGGLVDILQGELQSIIDRRESDDPSKDKRVLLGAMRTAFTNIINAHKTQAAPAAMPTPTT